MVLLTRHRAPYLSFCVEGKQSTAAFIKQIWVELVGRGISAVGTPAQKAALAIL